MVPVFLLVAGVTIALLILLSLFFIPVRARVALGNAPGLELFVAQASWAGIGGRMRMEGNETRQEILLAGHSLYIRTSKEGEAGPRGGEEEPRAPPPLRKVPHLLKLARPLLSLGGEVLHRTTLEEIRGRMRIGFRDPSWTGILFGWYCALLPVLACSRVSLEVTPVFDGEVLEGEVRARARIDRPLLLLLAAARLLLDRDVRAALSGLREG
jgi:hypothetical protein